MTDLYKDWQQLRQPMVDQSLNLKSMSRLAQEATALGLAVPWSVVRRIIGEPPWDPQSSDIQKTGSANLNQLRTELIQDVKLLEKGSLKPSERREKLLRLSRAAKAAKSRLMTDPRFAVTVKPARGISDASKQPRWWKASHPGKAKPAVTTAKTSQVMPPKKQKRKYKKGIVMHQAKQGVTHNYGKRGGRIGPPPKRVNYVPNSLAPTVKSGARVIWGPGSRAGCASVQIRFRIAQVVQCPSTEASADYKSRIAFQLGSSLSFHIALAIGNTFYFPSYITNLVQLFDFYKIRSAKFDYEPRISSSNAVNFVWSSVRDPEWFESHGLLSGGDILPSENALTSRENSCTSNAWSSCGLLVPTDNKREFFTAGAALTTKIDFSTNNPATIRQSVAGIVALFSDYAVAAAITTRSVVGDVYCRLNVELCDFSLATTTVVAASRIPEAKRWSHHEGDKYPVKENKSSEGSPYTEMDVDEFEAVRRDDVDLRHRNTLKKGDSSPRSVKSRSLK